MGRKKRGISTVIATVLLIFLTLVAVGLVSSIVVPLVKGWLYDSSKCIDYRDYFYFETKYGYNCINYSGTGNKLYALSVGAKVSGSNDDEKVAEIAENIEGFRLVLYNGSMPEILDVNNGSGVSTNVGGIKMIKNAEPKLLVPRPGEVRTYIHAREDFVDKAEVYVKLKNDELCEEKTDSINLDIPCDPTLAMSV
jgi:hypothetical protein